MDFKEPHRFLSQFFSTIWEKTPSLRGVELRIPDSIIVEDDVTDWYFTDKSGVVKKKLRENVKKDKIFERFRRLTQGCDIAAALMYISNLDEVEHQLHDQGISSGFRSDSAPQVLTPIRPFTTIQYLTLKELSSFDVNRQKSSSPAYLPGKT